MNETEQQIQERIVNVDVDLEALNILLEDTIADFSGKVELEEKELDDYEVAMTADLKNLAEELNITGADISVCVYGVERNISKFVFDSSEYRIRGTYSEYSLPPEYDTKL